MAGENISIRAQAVDLTQSETEKEDEQSSSSVPPGVKQRKTRDQLFISNQTSMIREVGQNTNTFLNKMGSVFQQAVSTPPPPIVIEAEPEKPKES